MCGIVARYSANGQIDVTAIEAAIATLKRRGPDGSGVWRSIDGSVALGHTRLATRGIDSGEQPMVFEQAQLSLVVNGELYDHSSLRTMLSQRGHHFSTDSDSELVAHLYLEFGMDFTAYLRGEFSFILWDGKQQRLIAGRDRFGIKPLVYTIANGEIYLASQSKALFALGHRAKWDEQSVLHCLTHQYLPTERTLFADIHQLPPGHLLCYQNNRLDIQSYWQAPLSVDTMASDFHENDMADLLEQAIEQRLEAEVPTAFSLSGGVDSSLVVAIAAKKMSIKPTCFNIAFFDKQYDESDKARGFCHSIGAQFHEVRVAADDLVKHCADAAYYSEGIGINGQYVGKYLLSKAVNAAGFKVMLSGEGADEAFMGYAHLQHDYYLHHNPPQANELLKALGKQFPLQMGVMMSTGSDLSSQFSNYLPAFLKTKMNMTKGLLPLLREPYRQSDFRQQSIHRLMAQYEGNRRYNSASSVEKSLQLWSELAMTGYILNTLGDGMEMAHSVEGRLPFLDHHLFAAAQRLPLTQKFSGMQAKHQLRLMAKKYLPNELAERPKHPFLAPPMIASLSRSGRDEVYDMLDLSVLTSNPFFDGVKVRRWLDAIFAAPKQQQATADPWLMMMLSMVGLQSAFSISDYG